MPTSRVPLTVILVNDFAHREGGISNVAICEALELVQKVDRVIFFAVVGPADPQLEKNGVEVHLLGHDALLTSRFLPASVLRGIRNTAARDALQRLVDSQTGSVAVHFHSWSKALSPEIFRLRRGDNVRTLCSIHDYFLACPNGGFLDYKKTQICKRTPLGVDCLTTNCDSRNYAFKMFRAVRSAYLKYSVVPADRVDRFLSVSQFAADALGRAFDFKGKLGILNNPIEVIRHPPVHSEQNKDLLFVGRMSPEKGVLELARFAAKAGIFIRYIGDGQMMSEVKKLHPQGEYLGWLPHAKTVEAMRGARYLVFPSLWYEAQALTVLEALSHGIPVITTTVNAAVERVKDGVNGLLFDPAKPADWESAFARTRDQTLTARLSAEAYRDYWASEQTPATHAHHLLQAYAVVFGETWDAAPQPSTARL